MIGDLRLAWRLFLRSRGASFLTVTMLAVGIAGTLTLHAVLTATMTLWPELPQRERLARIYASNARLGADRDAIPIGSWAEWSSRLAAFEVVAAFASVERPLDNAPDIHVQAVSSQYFDVLRVSPVAGRTLSRSDDAGEFAAVVGEGFARRRFGSASDALGKPIAVGRDLYTIVGVMPRDFYFPTTSVQVWIPLTIDRSVERVVGIGRLRTGQRWSEAAAELTAVARTNAGFAVASGWTLRPIPLDEDQAVRTRAGLLGLLGPALVVLLIACVNATNLMLSRGVERDDEFRVRLALGASRRRIMRQLLVEGAVVAAAAAAAGATLAFWGIRLLRSLALDFDEAMANRIVFTSGTLLAAAVIAIATPLVVSVLPAIAAARPRPGTSSGAIDSARGWTGYGARDALVIAEVALASVLVVTALMVFRLYGELQGVHPSYDPTPVATVSIGADMSANDLAAMVERARSVWGIVEVATVKGPLLPVDRSAHAVTSIAGKTAVMPSSVAEVSLGYFRTLRLPIVAGRSFDDMTGPVSGSAIVSAALAKRLWGGGLPAERLTVTVGGRSHDVDVVGVAADASAPNEVVDRNSGTVYLPADPAEGGPINLLARASGPATSIVGPLSHALAGGRDHGLLARPLADAIGFNARETILVRGLLGMFSTLALVLATGGIFAVSRHSVLRRTREFGIRLALGATSGRLVRLVVSHDMKLVAVAVAVSTGTTLAITRFTFVELSRLAVNDPLFWTRILALLGGASLLASYVAVRGVSRLEPMHALRDP